MRQLDQNASVRDLVAQAHEQGRAVRLVTGGVDRHSAFVAFAEGLGLPDWFGHNLDALVDALRELSDEQDRPIELIWDGAARLQATDPAAYERFCAALASVEKERGDLRVTVVRR